MISPFIYLPFYFFPATTKCLYKWHLFPTTPAQIPLCLSVSLFRGTPHNNLAISVPTLLLFRSYTEVFVQTAFIAYFPSGKSYFSICDHGPDSLHAVICDKVTFFTGGCSEGLGAFRFFFK